MKPRLPVGFILGFMAAIGLVGLVLAGSHLDRGAQAQNKASAADQKPVEWSPTKPYPEHHVYYPGTEELKADEMRVIVCGSGMPLPRLKQAAPCFRLRATIAPNRR